MLARRQFSLILIASLLPGEEILFDGWDPVTWFQPGKGQRGSSKFTASYKGQTVWFVSDANRKLFLSAPAKYLPEFGGKCALSLAHGKVEKADPACYRKQDGKVYLFANEQAAKTWEQDAAKEDLVPTATGFFKRLLGGG